jgi:uncharacterized protein YkwD
VQPSVLHRLCQLLVVLWLSSGCATMRGLANAPNVEVPPFATEYSTDAGSHGVRGGTSASDAEALLEKELDARGDEAEPESQLGATAAWILHRAYDQRPAPDTAEVTRIAQRFGYAGMIQGFALGDMGRADVRASLHALVAQVSKNSRINRYGIAGGRGADAAIVIGVVEASLEPFPRSVAPGGTLKLKGEVADSYERVSVFSTNPKGEVKEIKMEARSIEASLDFPEHGSYALEVMGYGAQGPTVLMNVPIRVGAPEAEAADDEGAADPSLTLEAAEARVLELLNEARAQARLTAVAPDAELREVALAHSTDMAEHGFAGHVSPTTGDPGDRVRKAKVHITEIAECVALNVSPERAHRALLDSPAHRAAMLSALYTHVGVGVAFTPENPEQPQLGRRLAVTLLFGRRVPPEHTRQLDAAATVSAIQALRQAKKLGPVRVDRGLTRVAEAGTRALQAGKTWQEASASMGTELQREVNRTRVARMTCQSRIEVLELRDLGALPLLFAEELGGIGLGVSVQEGEKGPRLVVVLVAEAAPKRTLVCR